jgi:hypothetical protein
MKSMTRLFGLMMLMTGFAGCQSLAVDGACPTLAPPPVQAVDALQNANDPSVDAWVVLLDRHYQKLKVCQG